MQTSNNYLEHTNLTVSNPTGLAKTLCNIFDWHVRWEGEALDHGYTVHVGEQNSYIALYSHPQPQSAKKRDHQFVNNLNHLGIVVNDLETVEQRVTELGIKPFNHREYDPGKRFYFLLDDDLEIEVVKY